MQYFNQFALILFIINHLRHVWSWTLVDLAFLSPNGNLLHFYQMK